MDLSKLDEPFESSDIEWRAQSCGKSSNGKFWVSVLAYVTNRAIMKRLDLVCGKGNWKNEYKDLPGSAGVECGLSIKIDGEWVTKWDAAPNTQIESTKGGRSDAMKRAAVQWGIGRYLYDLDTGWGSVVQNGAHKAKTKNNEWFQWNPPRLPDWALPRQTNSKSDKFSPSDCLSNFTSLASSADIETLQTSFKHAWRALEGYPEQAKAKEVYDLRKSELETPQA